MKKIILLLFLQLPLLSQNIPNGDFENWTNSNPDNWLTDNSPGFVIPVTQSSSSHSGSFAARLEVVDFGGSPYPPFLVSGQLGEGFPVNQRWESLIGFFQFAPVGENYFSVSVLMKKEGDFIGSGSIEILNASSSYSQFSLPIIYINSEIPDTAIVFLIIADSTNNGNIGSFALIDDLNWYKNPISVLSPNGGEVWGRNTIQEIQWSVDEIENVKIDYTTNDGTEWNNIIPNINGNIGTYNWSVPNTTSSSCKIRISDIQNSTTFDISDNFFTIGKTEIEPNNTTNTANLIEYGDRIFASISPSGDIDYFKFNVPNIDTIVLFAGRFNNSQLSFTYTITGNIISWDYYADSIYVILGSGICYLKFSSSSNLVTAKNDFNKTTNYDSFPLKKIKVKASSQSLNNNQIETSFVNENDAIVDTGEYQVILKKFIPGKPIIDQNIFYDRTFDELWNSVRFQVYFYPNGSNTNIRWEYGTDINYGNIKEFPETFTGIKEYFAITQVADLIPNTTYHFRIHLSNSYGDTYSADYTFNTPQTPDVEIIKPKFFINFSDTSFEASAGGGWYYVLVSIDLNSISFKDDLNGWIVGDPKEFIYTSDGGNTWNLKNSPINGWWRANDIYFFNSLNGFLISNGDSLMVFNTIDGGINWSQLYALYTNCSYGISEIDGRYINSSFSDLIHGSIVGSFGTENLCNNWNELFMLTTNGGFNWFQQNELGNYNSFNDVVLIDSLNCFVVGRNLDGGRILHTTNGGINWEEQNYSLNGFFSGVSFSNALHGTIIGYDFDEAKGIIIHTTNGGNTWNLKNDNLNNYNPVYYDIEFLDSLSGIIIGRNGLIIQTSDGGLTWNKRESGTNNDLYKVTLLGNNKFFITASWETILKGDIVTSVDEFENTIPNKFELSQNFPNPFNPSTKINYSVPQISFVTLKVYDILGKEVSTLVNEEKTIGNYEINFDANNLSSGVYFYRMQAGEFSETKKFILLR